MSIWYLLGLEQLKHILFHGCYSGCQEDIEVCDHCDRSQISPRWVYGPWETSWGSEPMFQWLQCLRSCQASQGCQSSEHPACPRLFVEATSNLAWTGEENGVIALLFLGGEIWLVLTARIDIPKSFWLLSFPDHSSCSAPKGFFCKHEPGMGEQSLCWHPFCRAIKATDDTMGEPGSSQRLLVTWSCCKPHRTGVEDWILFSVTETWEASVEEDD